MAVSQTSATINILGQMTVTSNGLPDPARYGTPLGNNRFVGNPNTVVAQSHNFVFPFRGGQNSSNPDETTLGPQGIALNGVVLFNPAAGPGPLPGGAIQPPQGFVWDAVFNETNYGVDVCGGHPEASGEYHYHSSDFLNHCWGQAVINSNAYFSATHYNGDNFRHPDGHSKIVGWCFDGYPVYGPFSYSDPDDQLSDIVRMTSSYRKRSEVLEGRIYDYSQLPAGTFIQDYEYVNDLGILDQHNGRYQKTPEYPNGTYAYFLSQDAESNPVYPYIFGPFTREQRPALGG